MWPYQSSVIISVIRDLFFSGTMPFVTHHQDQFPSRQGADDVTIWEVPKAMVALVSTAVNVYFHDCFLSNHIQNCTVLCSSI
jgi:hypothetical protein